MVFAKLLHKYMLAHLLENELLTEDQGGFLPNCGTQDIIGQFLGGIYSSININNLTLAIFLNLKKAFVTIDYSILLKKLNFLGFHGNTLSLLTNYLSNPRQATRLNSNTSSKLSFNFGVPQGSTLRPLLLFILYINDLPFLIENSSTKLYADDTVFYNSGPAIETLVAMWLFVPFQNTICTLFMNPVTPFSVINAYLICGDITKL